MLKILLAAGLIVLALFVFFILVMFGLVILMTFIIFTTRDDPEAVVRRRTSDIAPLRDDALFNRLAAEAMAYATRPFVSTIVDVNGDFLLSTVSDPFGKHVYAESRRRVSKGLKAVICVYEEGGPVPAAAAETEIPMSHVDWSAHYAAMKDIQADGPKMSYVDQLGRRREIRIPTGGRHHA